MDPRFRAKLAYLFFRHGQARVKYPSLESNAVNPILPQKGEKGYVVTVFNAAAACRGFCGRDRLSSRETILLGFSKASEALKRVQARIRPGRYV